MSHDSLRPGTVIKLRRDTAANWITDNPVLEEGETGWETDTGRVKLGNGTDAWVDLAYAAGEAVDPTVGVFRSTDGSFGLSAPTGVGGELIVEANVLEDIRYNGVPL